MFALRTLGLRTLGRSKSQILRRNLRTSKIRGPVSGVQTADPSHLHVGPPLRPNKGSAIIEDRRKNAPVMRGVTPQRAAQSRSGNIAATQSRPKKSAESQSRPKNTAESQSRPKNTAAARINPKRKHDDIATIHDSAARTGAQWAKNRNEPLPPLPINKGKGKVVNPPAEPKALRFPTNHGASGSGTKTATTRASNKDLPPINKDLSAIPNLKARSGAVKSGGGSGGGRLTAGAYGISPTGVAAPVAKKGGDISTGKALLGLTAYDVVTDRQREGTINVNTQIYNNGAFNDEEEEYIPAGASRPK